LSPEGATAVENDGIKYPSALWMVQPYGERDGAILARPFKLLSVGLTAYPNISGVESLANSRVAEAASSAIRASNAGASETQDMNKIIGWLLANGIDLSNSNAPTEDQVLEALQKFHTSKPGEVTTLGNEKSTLAGEKQTLTSKVTTLENEK